MYLFRLIYYSRNAIDPEEAPLTTQVKQILGAARTNNPPLGISGTLMFNADYFVQALEGDRKVVSNLFCKIANDHRHRQIVILDAQAVDERLFSEWTMGFVGQSEAAQELYRRYTTGNFFQPAKMTSESLLRFMVALSKSDPNIAQSAPKKPARTIAGVLSRVSK